MFQVDFHVYQSRVAPQISRLGHSYIQTRCMHGIGLVIVFIKTRCMNGIGLVIVIYKHGV